MVPIGERAAASKVDRMEGEEDQENSYSLSDSFERENNASHLTPIIALRDNEVLYGA